MALRIAEKAALTDVGRQRQSNEDAYLERSPLFAVADGMGGARAGEVASKIAVEAFGNAGRPDATSPEEQLAEVARAANRRIYDMAQQDSELAGMGTTLVAALVTERGEIAVGHVGDSRLYRLREGHLERLTQDHSLVEELVRQGKLRPEQAEVHPQRSIITRALGPEPDVQVDTYTYPARSGDVYLICSDGLTGMIQEEDVERIVDRAGSLDAAARELVAGANAAGGKDNITVVLFRVEDADGAGAAEEHDTLGGGEEAAVRGEQVRAALADGAGDEQTTMALKREDAAAARAATSPVADEEAAGGVPATSPLAPRGRRRMTLRAKVTTVLVLVAIGAVIAGLYAGSRQFWFVGTDDRGQVTLYQGMPYDLPLGISLYTQKYVSGVPASVIKDRRRRDHDLDQSLRSKGDATDLVRTLERTYARP